ncbi:beta-glucosidase BglX [Carboxylicivirga mesophila]|uniref:beta-glucosidase n=1 Tax=Carboxylicivirga mesophila TaxID=1166478 RepID=A0ABS5KAU0_9BACT|nr:beta-glucosidase BglX [Carboxylicivirga mesophila]MBS2212095.1 beta-glucosidase BglX [Carboxylicivirga mesophila]
MRNLNLLALITMLLLVSCAGNQKQLSEEDQFVEDLLMKMTLAEKVGQLNQYTSLWEMTGPAPAGNAGAEALLEQLKSGMVGSMLNVNGAEATRKAQQTVVENTRLGIPLIFGYDVIHGYKTMFPIPLAEAASWNPELARQSSEVAAKEAAVSGLHWTFAPMVDVGRDARWGRVMEGAGEDPYLGSAFARARVHGFQGDNLSNEFTIAACAKHFAGYAFSESGRDYNSVEIGNETLHNIVLPPFKAAAEAGVTTFMNGFNTINGLPVTADSYLQRDLLKGDWHFDGFVVSDWNSIGEIEIHGAAANSKESAERAIKGGSDMDMEGRAYISHLEELVTEGKVDEKLVTDAARRVLRIKYRLGLFDDPYKYCNEENERQMILTDEHRAASRKVARESMVLLKNEKQILPLSTNAKSIAVIGPLADDKDSPLGNWRAQAESNSAVSLLEGVKAAIEPSVKLNYAQGCALSVGTRNFSDRMTFNETDRSGFGKAIAAARQSEVVLLAIGEDCYQSGEGRSMTDIKLKGLQQELFDEIYKVNKNIVVVLMNGRPLAIPEIAEKAAAILETWHSGTEGGHAIADVLFGKYNPSGKLPVSFPRNVGQCPLFYNYKNTGRPVGQTPEWVLYSCYNDAPNTPLFPFGYGLSYTSFSYSDMILDKEIIAKDGQLTINVSVTNAGKVDGEEVVQLYIQDIAATYARPVKELKGFEKVLLKAGETKELTFTLTEKELGYYFPNGTYVVEPGQFNVFVGTNSEEVQKATFSIQ